MVVWWTALISVVAWLRGVYVENDRSPTNAIELHSMFARSGWGYGAVWYRMSLLPSAMNK